MTKIPSDGQRQASYQEALESSDKKTVTAPHLSDRWSSLFKAASAVVITAFLPQI